MGIISREQLLLDFKNKKFAPIYFLYGDEVVFIEEFTEKFLNEVLLPQEKDFNAEVHDGENIDGNELLAIVKAFPMMSERRLVVIKNCEKIPNAEVLSTYFENPADSTILVLTSNNIDLRKKPYNSLSLNASTLKCDFLKANELSIYIDRFVKSKNKKITSRGIDQLIYFVGNSLLDIKNALEKVILLKDKSETINENDISEIVGSTREIKIYEMTNHVANRDLEKSLTVLEKILFGGENPIRIVSTLTWHFTILLRMSAAREVGSPIQPIAQEYKIFPYYIPQYEAQSKKFTGDELQNIIIKLADADKELKSTSTDKTLIIELLIQSIISKNNK